MLLPFLWGTSRGLQRPASNFACGNSTQATANVHRNTLPFGSSSENPYGGHENAPDSSQPDLVIPCIPSITERKHLQTLGHLIHRTRSPSVVQDHLHKRLALTLSHFLDLHHGRHQQEPCHGRTRTTPNLGRRPKRRRRSAAAVRGLLKTTEGRWAESWRSRRNRISEFMWEPNKAHQNGEPKTKHTSKGRRIHVVTRVASHTCSMHLGQRMVNKGRRNMYLKFPNKSKNQMNSA